MIWQGDKYHLLGGVSTARTKRKETVVAATSTVTLRLVSRPKSAIAESTISESAIPESSAAVVTATVVPFPPELNTKIATPEPMPHDDVPTKLHTLFLSPSTADNDADMTTAYNVMRNVMGKPWTNDFVHERQGEQPTADPDADGSWVHGLPAFHGSVSAHGEVDPFAIEYGDAAIMLGNTSIVLPEELLVMSPRARDPLDFTLASLSGASWSPPGTPLPAAAASQPRSVNDHPTRSEPAAGPASPLSLDDLFTDALKHQHAHLGELRAQEQQELAQRAFLQQMEEQELQHGVVVDKHVSLSARRKVPVVTERLNRATRRSNARSSAVAAAAAAVAEVVAVAAPASPSKSSTPTSPVVLPGWAADLDWGDDAPSRDYDSSSDDDSVRDPSYSSAAGSGSDSDSSAGLEQSEDSALDGAQKRRKVAANPRHRGTRVAVDDAGAAQLKRAHKPRERPNFESPVYTAMRRENRRDHYDSLDQLTKLKFNPNATNFAYVPRVQWHVALESLAKCPADAYYRPLLEQEITVREQLCQQFERIVKQYPRRGHRSAKLEETLKQKLIAAWEANPPHEIVTVMRNWKHKNIGGRGKGRATLVAN